MEDAEIGIQPAESSLPPSHPQRRSVTGIHGSHAADESISSSQDSFDDDDDDSDEQLQESDLNQLESSIRQSKSIDDFARLITEFRMERKRRSYHARSSGQQQRNSQQLEVPNGTPGGSGFLSNLARSASNRAKGEGGSRKSRTYSQAGSEEGASPTLEASPRKSMDAVSIATSRRDSWKPISRCTCCCGQEGCESAKRATTEWADMEQDLKLAAEIGQALLRRNDVLTESARAQEGRHANQLDSLMRRLTKTIKESDAMEKRLEQNNLNLEAADSSNRALLSELEECRRELTKVKTERAKLAAMEERSQRISKWLEDARQEVQVERRKTAAAEARAKRSAEKVAHLSESIKQAAAASRNEESNREALMKARARLREETLNASSETSQAQQEETLQTLEGLAKDNEALLRQVEQTNLLLQSANEELSTLREAEINRPTHTRVMSRNSRSYGFSDAYRGPSSSGNQRAGEGETDEVGEETTSRLLRSPRPFTPTLADEAVAENGGLFPNAPRRSLSLSSRAPSRTGSAIEGQTPGENGISPRFPQVLLLSPSLPQGDLLPPSSGRITPTSTSEAQRIRAAYMTSSSDAASSTAVEEPSSSATQPHQVKRDNRTNQLVALLDYVQRLVGRLSNADVDTMGRRLQRQHLAGDVGHLSRVTINAITRDAEAMREHFRKLIEAEARSQANLVRDDTSLHSTGDAASSAESLVARKEFFALIKLLRDMLFEAAKLRNAINEVQLAPANAAKILQEQLGAATPHEDKGMGAWLGGLLRGVAGAAVPASIAASNTVTQSTSAGSPVASPTPTPGASTIYGPSAHANMPSLVRAASRGGSGTYNAAMPAPPRPASRASAAVLSSTVAVEFKGTRMSSGIPHTHAKDPSGLDEEPSLSSSPAAEGGKPQPRPKVGRAGHGLSRVQSRNLSGLFAGAPPDGWTVVNPRLSAVPARYAQPQSSSISFLGGGSLAGGAQSGPGHHRPLSRIVDDDEVSIRQNKPAWGERGVGRGGSDDEDGDTNEATRPKGMRARGLSDSSIRSTFLDHDTEASSTLDSRTVGLGINTAVGKRISPASRIMNRGTLALQPGSGPVPIASGGGSDATRSNKVNDGEQPRSRAGGFLAGLGNTLGLSSLARQPSHSAIPRSTSASSSTSITETSIVGVLGDDGTGIRGRSTTSNQNLPEFTSSSSSSTKVQTAPLASAITVPSRSGTTTTPTATTIQAENRGTTTTIMPAPLLSPFGTSPAPALTSTTTTTTTNAAAVMSNTFFPTTDAPAAREAQGG